MGTLEKAGARGLKPDWTSSIFRCYVEVDRRPKLVAEWKPEGGYGLQEAVLRSVGVTLELSELMRQLESN